MTQQESPLSSPVREIENAWITLSDGCRLAARIWMPEAATAAPVPAVLEYIPYRKRDFTRRRDESMHRLVRDAWLRLDTCGHARLGRIRRPAPR